ncbi:unnamed protein product [Blumeria hordei]|uniref:Candidate secreted effector protein n=2 Tax=Blumeria hordei TaxID=2867405 RepID=A0A383UHJ7_BLUHO|nr:putative candidate secreted effector protein [Blumeria hordei DH14]SZE99291.1 unnamed protein product [Blumeria hordei]
MKITPASITLLSFLVPALGLTGYDCQGHFISVNVINHAINSDISSKSGRHSYQENAGLHPENRSARISYNVDGDPYWGAWVEYGQNKEILEVYSSSGKCGPC